MKFIKLRKSVYVLLFLPLFISGLNKPARTMIVVLLISAIIEMIQFIFKAGVFDLDDILLNTIDGLTGFCIYRLIGNRGKTIIFYKN